MGFALELVPRAPRKHGGERVSRNFCTAKRGGENRLRADIFAPNTGGKRFFCPFFGGVFWVFGSFTDFWMGGLPKRKQQKQREQRNLEEKKKQRSQGGAEEEKRRRRRRRRKKKEEKGEEEE